MEKIKKTGAQVLIDCLENQGIEHIFGYPGGANIPIFDALLESSINLVLTRHEQGASHMADGIARATGKAGVALVTSGPGATNTVTGILTACMDSVPMVIICGQTITANLGLDAFQEADVSGITYPVVKHSYLIKDANDIARIVKEAFYIAETGRPGPVLIDLPKDISSAEIIPEYQVEMNLPGYSFPGKGDSIKIQQIAQALKKAKKPLFLIGQGCIIANAQKAIFSLVEKTQIPVVNTLLGKGAFPESHDLNLGMLGMHGTAYANFAIIECDLIMSIGSRWDDRITGKLDEFCKDAVKIHIDIDPAEHSKLIEADYSVVGDARLVVEELNTLVETCETQAWLKLCQQLKKKYPLNYKKQGGLKAQHVIDQLYKLTEGKAIVTVDVGQHQMWAAQFYLTDAPRKWISSGGAGTMGFGFPAAIGAQLGCPNELVVTIVGDGGFQMTLCELSTAVLQKLPIKIIVIDNKHLGMVRQWQDMFFENRISGVDLVGNPDFVKLGQAYGVKGFRIKRSADVNKVLTQAINYNEGPCIIHAEVEKQDNVFPMIPANAPYEKMLLERPKHKMEKPTGST